jgi:hypothetical protein
MPPSPHQYLNLFLAPPGVPRGQEAATEPARPASQKSAHRAEHPLGMQ